MRLKLPERTIEFPRPPLVMGIVNVNDDSFCGDGTLDFEAALGFARTQAALGADILDIGAESARTNRAAIPVEEEVRRLRGVTDRFAEIWQDLEPRDSLQIWPPILSVNTWRPEAVEAVMASGNVELVNDMGALPDERNARICAKHGAALLIMHSVGEPKIPHFHQQWPDVMNEIESFFEAKLKLATAAGLSPESLILDPGIDFAKQQDDNLRVMRELRVLTKFRCPILMPVSRKTVIGSVLGIEDPNERDAGTIACVAAGMSRGANIFRVHNVAAAWQATRTLAAINS